MTEAKHSPLLPLAYTDGIDYCTVKDAVGNAFALTVQPAELREMERATSLHHELVAALEDIAGLKSGSKFAKAQSIASSALQKARQP